MSNTPKESQYALGRVYTNALRIPLLRSSAKLVKLC